MPRAPSAKVPPLVRLMASDRRYTLDAYNFVRAGLVYAQDVMGLGREDFGQRDDQGQPAKHVSGRDLCIALKQLAHENYGYMARLVLASWGIHSTSDFGEIVYNLIAIGEMTRSPIDRREDFDDVYDFEEALMRDFVITAPAE